VSICHTIRSYFDYEIEQLQILLADKNKEACYTEKTDYPVLDSLLGELSVCQRTLNDSLQHVPQTIRQHPARPQPVKRLDATVKFKEMLATLIKMNKFSFNIDRNNEKEIKVTFTASVSRKTSEKLEDLYDCFQIA
jgi:septum formation inhibitor MinC